MIPKPIVLLLSGGLDSVTLAYDLKSQGCIIHALLFDYGQVHRKELKFAQHHADSIKLRRTVIELHQIKGLFSHSALTDGKGGLVVPNRNAVFVHIAASIAMASGAESVAIGCNKDDQYEFPDCRWEWIEAMNKTLQSSEVGVELLAPYIGLTKWQIVRRARDLGVEVSSTWSCYGDGANPCGKCLACRKLRKACA